MQRSEAPGHLSIGEVLSLLQGDFPDVTISKIRFLESQGLIDPERTPSGYRKFYEADIERLRWILRQQRDHFLPLRVIKAMLESGDLTEPEVTVQSALFGEASEAPQPRASVDAGQSAPSAVRAADEHDGESGVDPAGWLKKLVPPKSEPPTPPERVDAAAGAGRPTEAEGLRFGVAEAAEVTGVDAALIESLVEFGLVTPRVVGGEPSFDAAAIAVVRAASPLLARGIEARHLRAFKNAADREAGFYEQMILPLLKQRNPKARTRATDTLHSLVGEGAALSASLVQSALQHHFD